MHSRLLIDQIMQQTTVLIAQLSTAAGIRAPLSHIADQVFLDLSNSIESQGVSRKVAADMFGLALRTYQRRVQAITESVSVRNRTIWEAIFEYIQHDDGRLRGDILHRFRWDEESSVKAVIHDLVTSGLIYGVGRGENTLYKVTPEHDLKTLAESGDNEHLAALVWVHIYRQGAVDLSQLADQLRQTKESLRTVLERLISEGKLLANQIDNDEGSKITYYQAQTCSVPIGDKQGWEAAVYDHFQSMAKAIANKLNQYGAGSDYKDHIGGATLSFDLYPGHPQEDEVLSLLNRYRKEINVLWDKVVQTNQAQRDEQSSLPIQPTPSQPTPSQPFKVTFYLGQNVEQGEHISMPIEDNIPHTSKQ